MATRSTSGSTCRRLWLALAFAAAIGCGGPRGGGSGPTVNASFAAADGGTIELHQYRGRVVVLHFFATWSITAQADVAELVELSRNAGTEVVVIGVALDKEAGRVLGAWRRAAGATYLLGIAGDRVRTGNSTLGKIPTIPTTWVLDRRGAIAHRIARPLARGEIKKLVGGL